MENRPIIKHLRTDISGKTLDGLNENISGVTEIGFGEIAINYNTNTPMLMIRTSGATGIGVTEFYDKSHIIRINGLIGGIQDDIIDIENRIGSGFTSANTIRDEIDIINNEISGILISGVSTNIIGGDGINVVKSGINNTISITIDNSPNNDGYIYANSSGVGISGLTSKFNNIDTVIDEINSKTSVPSGDTILKQSINGGLVSEINLVKLSNPSPEYAATYQLQGVDGMPIGANINIPLDQFLENASFFPVLGSVEKNLAISASNSGVSVSPDPETLDVSKSYIKFIFSTTAGSEWLYLDVSTLVEKYTAGYGITMSGDSQNIITVDTNVIATRSSVSAIEEVLPISAFTNQDGAYYGQTVVLLIGNIHNDISTIYQIVENINDDVRRQVGVYSDLFDLSGLTLGSRIYVINDEVVALTPFKSGLYVCSQVSPTLIFKRLLYEDDYANVNIVGGFGISANTVNDVTTIGLTDLSFEFNTTDPQISIDVGTF